MKSSQKIDETGCTSQEEILLHQIDEAASFPLRLEREYIRLVCDMAAQRGLNYSQFARQAFPNDASPEVKWRQIRNVSKAGKPQRLSMADAFRLAEALEQYFPALCFLAFENLKLRGQGPDTEKQGSWNEAVAE